MKGKFSSVWRVATALVLALSLALVVAAPALANVSTPTVSLSSTLVSANSTYTIGFTTTATLTGLSSNVTVTFPTGTTVPATGQYSTGAITIQGTNVPGGDVTVNGQALNFLVPASISPGPVEVIFVARANILNPSTPGPRTLTVNTSAETAPVTSVAYSIVTKPTVTEMDRNITAGTTVTGVILTGTYFTAATSYNGTVSAVSVNGSGVTVDSFSVTNATTISANIAVAATAAAGARSVTVTNLAGSNTTASIFNVVTTGILVDRYNSSNVFQAQTSNVTAAIAVASASDILKVHAGSDNLTTGASGETFPIMIDKEITLKSYMDANSTTIGPPPAVTDPNITDGMTIKVAANDVTIGGSGAGFTIITRVTAGIWTQGTANSTTGLQILYNKFQAVTQGESKGIWLDTPFTATSSSRNAIIDHNDFSQATAYSASGGQGAPGTGIQIVQAAIDGSTRALITNNTAANQRYTWLTFKNERKNVASDGPGNEGKAVASMTVAGVDVYGNVVHDNGRALQFSRKGTGSESLTIGNDKVKVYKNAFYSNGDGVRIDADSSDSKINTVSNIQIQYNDIYSNTKTTSWTSPTKYGITSGQTSANVSAQYNWWGSIGGPGGEGMGAGNNVTSYVTYDPWLTGQYATVISDSIREYGSDAIALQVGWNTLSVPTGMKTSGDTFGEILAVGTYIDSDHYVGAYTYNTQTSAWESVSSSTQLVPGKGYYIKMSAASRFPVLYFDGSLYLPSYSVYSGWNLIGSMFGVDGDTGDFGVAYNTGSNGEKTPLLALNSISSKASVVISPSVPGQVSAWAALASEGTLKMRVGEAYWVFLTGDSTLAGFELTPYYFTWSAP